MSRRSDPAGVTGLQLEILQILWEKGEATVTQVHEALGERGRKMAYTSAMTLCKRMAAKGLLKYRQQDRAYIYSAAVKRQGTLRGMLGGIIDRAFEGSVARLAMSMLADEPIDEHELADLQKLLQAKQRELQQRGKSR